MASHGSRGVISRRRLATLMANARGPGGGHGAAVRTAVTETLAAALEDSRAAIRRRFEASGQGLVAARENALLMERVVGAGLDSALLGPMSGGGPLSVLAVGGFGRGVLAPHSDLDLLFLFADAPPAEAEAMLRPFLYLLWDLGFKVGHSARSVEQCLAIAKEDITVRTALLESRHLWGARRLSNQLARRFRAEIVRGSEAEFVAAKLAERDARHRRFGDSRYVVEPNLKEGKGGLRDLHTLFWIAKYLYGVKSVSELVERKVLTRAEHRTFDTAAVFLWSVRHHLHYLAGRAEERITFDVQPTLGGLLNYADRAGGRGVERFMKHYFLIAKDVGDLTRLFCANLEESHLRQPRAGGDVPRVVEGFLVVNGRLRHDQESAFVDDAVAMIRLFHVADRHRLDIHPQALRLIRRDLKGIDAKLRADPEANRLFLEVLTSPFDPETALRRLNEAGVFGRFVPDFGRVVAQMQYDMYHVYTVDEHAIRAIGLLSRIEQGDLAEEHPVSHEMVHQVLSRRALYVGLLLHDIGKGQGTDHSTYGANVARRLGPRLGLTAEETETAAWLVRHHLLFADTAFKRDVGDPKTVADFVAIVQSPERLRLLLVLTVADIRAVGPGRWNGWKGQLLRDLYHAAEAVMTGGHVAGDRGRRAAAAKHAFATAADTSGAPVRSAALDGLDDAYWLSAGTEIHVRHAHLLAAAAEVDPPFAVGVWSDTFRAVTEVVVCARDRAGLFARLAGAMARAGASIVDAKIFTTTNGTALDTFWIQDARAGPLSDARRVARLKAAVIEVVADEGPLEPLVLEGGRLPSRTAVFTVEPRVLIDNRASDIHTVVEINGRDRPGLLYDLTRVLADLRLSIASAHIATFGEHAVDVFYVKDRFGLKVTREETFRQLRGALLEVLQAPRSGPVAARGPRRLARRSARVGGR